MDKKSECFDSIIIGGGAAGLFCAVHSAWQGLNVLLIEKNDVFGKKLAITGKGRCNVTNNCDISEVMKNIPRNSKFLFSALNRFSPEDTMAFFESIGVRLKTERGNRVFPVSDNAHQIVDALVHTARESGVKFVHDRAVKLIFKSDDKKEIKGVSCEKGDYFADKVVIATGGKSYPKTGSTGDGYKFAESAGHRVTEITPSLCPIVTKEHKECAEAMGLSLRNCTLKLFKEGDPKPIYQELGEMLFTHFGLSGPLVLSASAHIENIGKTNYFIDIDLKPALDDTTLDKRIQRDFKEFPNRNFANSLNALLPAKIIPIIVKRSEIDGEKKVNQITKEERHKLVWVIKNLRYAVSRLRPIDEAIITRGGVDVSQINPKNMESKLCHGLYFIGEVLDVDAYTGGFNLQIAFSTACAIDN